jgi:DNA-binding transcriptional LysR family regulator
MALDPRRLCTWHTVASTGSIKQAAIDLGYSSSAVSQQIAALQRETGTTLLEPDGRGVRPTAAGQLLAGHAARIVAQLAQAEDELAAMRDGQIGTLRVGSFASAGSELVPRALSSVRATLPQIEINLRSAERPDALALLSRGLIDLAVIETHSWVGHPEADALIFQPLLTDPYRLVLPRKHRLARRRRIDLSEVRGESWIDLRCEVGCCRTATTQAFAHAGLNPTWVAEADDYWPAQGFVAAGLGLALIPALALGVIHADTVVRALGPHNLPTRDVLTVTRPALQNTITVRAMTTALADAARQQPQPARGVPRQTTVPRRN